jgi:hypothetical protein
MTFSTDELRIIRRALDVAAEVYLADARAMDTDRMRETFTRQAFDAQNLAARVEMETGDLGHRSQLKMENETLVLWECDDGTYDICENGEVIRMNVSRGTLLAADRMRAALEIVSRCVADSDGGTTLGTYEMGIVRDALASATS